MAKRLNDKAYRGHIVAAGNRIQRYLKKKTLNQFLKDEMLQAAVIRELEIIGEAAKNLSLAFKSHHSHVPWRKVTGMRDVAIHDYFILDLPAVWGTATRRVPELLRQLKDEK